MIILHRRCLVTLDWFIWVRKRWGNKLHQRGCPSLQYDLDHAGLHEKGQFTRSTTRAINPQHNCHNCKEINIDTPPMPLLTMCNGTETKSGHPPATLQRQVLIGYRVSIMQQAARAGLYALQFVIICMMEASGQCSRVEEIPSMCFWRITSQGRSGRRWPLTQT